MNTIWILASRFSSYPIGQSSTRSAYFSATALQFILLIGAILVTLIASAVVKSAAAKYSKVRAQSGMTGAQTAHAILKGAGILDVQVASTGGSMTDHYNPRSKQVVLGEESCQKSTITAIAVAAHECGHAIQDARGYLPLRIRSSIVPVTNIASRLAWPLIFIGIIFAMPGLTNVGIVLFSAVVVFQLVTLPVEFNASSRALAILDQSDYLTKEEMHGARKVLNAAAMTYVAALASSAMTLLRLLLLRQNRR